MDISLAVTLRDFLQHLFSNRSLFVFLDGFVLMEERCILFSRSCLDQNPIVSEAGEVQSNECSDTVEETDKWSYHYFGAKRNSVDMPVSTRGEKWVSRE